MTAQSRFFQSSIPSSHHLHLLQNNLNTILSGKIKQDTTRTTVESDNQCIQTKSSHDWRDRVKEAFNGVKPTEIINRINQALAGLEVMVAGRKLEVKGAAILPSGSIKLFTTTRAEAEWLLENRIVWSTVADPEFVTSPAVFPVVIDSVPMNKETYPATDVIKCVMTEQNPILNPMAQQTIPRTDKWFYSCESIGQRAGK